MQFGHGNFPSASLVGMTALLELPFAPPLVTAARPGALGKIPLLPCEPTTWVLGCSLEASGNPFGTVSVFVHNDGLLSGCPNGGLDMEAKSFRSGAGAIRGWYACEAVVVGG